jgi:4-hydroxybenzoyl-CoA reductase subunit beta
MNTDTPVIQPDTAAAAVAALAAGGRALAGGTDLLPNLRRGIGRPDSLVDLTALAGFDTVEVDAAGGLRLGAGVRLETLAEDPAIAAGWPALARAAALVAGPTHRAQATLGGNLCQDTRCIFYNQSEWWRRGNGYCLKVDGDRCHVVIKSDRCYATYHGDVAPALMVLGAVAEILGPDGRRDLPIAELFRESGADWLTLAPGEMLVAVRLPAADGWRADYAKARVRDAIDFPLAGVAVALRREGERIAGLRIAVTGSNSAPLILATEALTGRPWDPETAAALVETVRKGSRPLRTTITPVGYRRRVLGGLARRLVDQMWQAAE